MPGHNIVNLFVIARKIRIHKKLGPGHACMLPAVIIACVQHGVVGHISLKEDAVQCGLVHLVPELGVGGLEDVLTERGMAGRPDLAAKEDETTHA